MCEEHDIMFICLPANSTHLTQPLDVALFGPLKKKWKEILLDYKRKNPEISAVRKPKFPSMLNKLMKEMKTTIHSNIKSGFKTCGIVPVDSEVVKAKLQYTQVQETIENEDMISFLRQQRGLDAQPTAPVQDTQPTSSMSGAVVSQLRLDAQPTASVQDTQPTPSTSGAVVLASQTPDDPLPDVSVTPSSSAALPATPNAPKSKGVKRKKSNSITPGRPVKSSDIKTPITKKARATSVANKKKENREVNLNAPQEKNPPSVGDCVIVNLSDEVRKKTLKYGGIVTAVEVETNLYNVTFLKAVNNSNKKIFVLNEKDSSWETIDNMHETKIPFVINNRGQYVFTTRLNIE